jgi:hypothetical protein
LLDPHSKNQTIRLAGETLTHNQAVAVYEQVSGKKLEVVKKSLKEVQEEEATFVPLLQALILQNATSVNFEGNTDNWRYPSVIPSSVKEFFHN